MNKLNSRLFSTLIAPVVAVTAFSTNIATAHQTRTIPQGLTAARNTLWKNRRISVCWENPTSSNRNLRGVVRNAIQNTWAKYSSLSFSGWGKCQSSSKGIRIKIADEHPHTKGLGTELDGKKNGMVLNFTFNNWSQSCKTKVNYCVRTIAVHEFGHALGFSHEHNRKHGIPEWCKDKKQGSNGGWLITPYDLNSVMNYCNPKWAGDGNLSNLDITGLRKAYGSPGSSPNRNLARWYVAFGGNQSWVSINGANETYLRTGDFDGDGFDDVFTSKNGSWYVSYRGLSSWTKINRANDKNLRFGDFDGDGKTDVFIAKNGFWYVSYGGKTRWTKINKASDPYLRFGDFNGDGKTDVFTAKNGKWLVSYGGKGRWTKINSARDPYLRFGDFNGDKKTDVFTAKNGFWYVSYGGKTRWSKINKSNRTNLRFGDFNGDGRTDVFHSDGRHFYISYGGKSRWRKLYDTAATGNKALVLGDFNGDKKTDVLVRW